MNKRWLKATMWTLLYALGIAAFVLVGWLLTSDGWYCGRDGRAPSADCSELDPASTPAWRLP